MHRHDLFPLSLMNFLLSSHSAIFICPDTFLYEQADQRDSLYNDKYQTQIPTTQLPNPLAGEYLAESAGLKALDRKHWTVSIGS